MQLSQKFSTRTNGFVHSSSLLYRPIKRHNWSVPVQPLAQKNRGTQKPQKTGRKPSQYYQTLRKDAWIKDLTLPVGGLLMERAIHHRLSGLQVDPGNLNKGVNGLKVMALPCIMHCDACICKSQVPEDLLHHQLQFGHESQAHVNA